MAAKKIFFSYSRADGFAFARRLAVDLKKKGYDIWIDQEDIKAGLQWDTEIEKALESCDCVLFLETEKSVTSRHVLDEVYYALEQNKKVIPLIFVDSKTPFRLKRLQHIDFTRNYNSGLNLLLNELEGNAPAVTYLQEEGNPVPVSNKSYAVKKAGAFVLIACLGGLIIALFALSAKDKTSVSVETKGAKLAADSISTYAGGEINLPNTTTSAFQEENEASTEQITPLDNKKKNRDKKAFQHSGNANTGQTGHNNRMEKGGLLNETVAGNWRLIDVEPKAETHRGYLKIEPLDENKIAIKSYMQFYYPESEASSYLTVFNAFANCPSCALNKKIKLTVEDIAVGSRTIKKFTEDQPDGRKAGEVILDANANKSIGGVVTLHFVDNNTAVIKVTQPKKIALSNEFILEAFVYSFRFKKNH